MSNPEIPVSVIALGATVAEFGNETRVFARVPVHGPGTYEWRNDTGDTQYVFAVVKADQEIVMQLPPLPCRPGDTYRLSLP